MPNTLYRQTILLLKDIGSIAAILLFLLLINGCAGKSFPLSDIAPPPIETQIPTEYKELAASSSQRPPWIDAAPDDSGEMHFLVGLSEHHLSERAAREDAMQHSREQYAQYTGVDISLVDKVIRTLHGSSSDVFDPTVSSSSQATHTTEAQVSRIKAKEWYWMKYRATKRGDFRGNVYKYWVLVTVPVDEYQRVQELKRKWEEEEALAESKLATHADQVIEKSLNQYNSALAAIKDAANTGNTILALNKIQAEWNRLYGDIQGFSDKGQPYTEKTDVLKQAQISLTGQIASIRSSLYIDTGRSGTVYILPAANETNCTAWVWARTTDAHKPVSGVPLVLTDQDQKIIARAISSPSGKADFLAAGLIPGQYQITIDSTSPTFSLLDKSIVDSISKVENRLFAGYATTDIKGAADIAIKKLFSGPALEPLPVKTVAVGPVTYSDSLQGSSFGHTLQQLFRQSLTSIDGLAVVDHKKRNAEAVAQAANTRGIGLTTTSQKAPSMGSAAMQAVIDGAQAAVEATYTVYANEIWVNVSLKEAGTDILQGASSVVIDKRSVPSDLVLVPQVATKPASQETKYTGGSITLELTSHLGDGQTYMEGDTISYFVSMDRDAYLLLIYEDAQHNLIQILPNRYSGSGHYMAGRFIEVPGGKDPFEFVIEGPFGLESVWAFAASRPFPALSGAQLENGLILLNENLHSVLAKVRAHGKNADIAYGEKQATITTVPKTNIR